MNNWEAVVSNERYAHNSIRLCRYFEQGNRIKFIYVHHNLHQSAKRFEITNEKQSAVYLLSRLLYLFVILCRNLYCRRAAYCIYTNCSVHKEVLLNLFDQLFEVSRRTSGKHANLSG